MKLGLTPLYSFYQKIFTEQTNFLWAGLAKLAGAPVYAGLSDAEYSKGLLAFFGNTNIEPFQETLLQMNIDIYSDLAWQFEAYRKGGICALEEVASHAVGNKTIIDIAPWRIIDQGIQATNLIFIQNGNKALLQREQLTVLANGYNKLRSMGSITTFMSYLAKNPVPDGPDFATLEPYGNIVDFSARWDWITQTGDGMWPLWLAESLSDQLYYVGIPLKTRALNYSTMLPLPIY